MFSSRLYPLFVRAVSFQTCDRTSGQLWMISSFLGVLQVCTKKFLRSLYCTHLLRFAFKQ
ncbi:hypothetical protein C7J99_09515 [Brevibacillus brevis]|nr:hypothetical protein C7J99_09515 [Brevibacillus brevis]